MTAESWRRIDGVARKRKQRWMNRGGVATRIKERWANIGGVARCIWREAQITLVSGTYTSNTSFGTASFALQSNGGIFHVNGPGSGPTQSHWIVPQDGMSEYQVRATLVQMVGTGNFIGTYNNWLSLGSGERAWAANRASVSGPGEDRLVFDLAIRRASDGEVLVSGRRITLISAG